MGKNPKEQSEFAQHNDEQRGIWDSNAEWWDDRIGDGNDFQRELIDPATERLIRIEPGATVLDIACGAGRFGRRMAELGAHVVAFDFSERFLQRAGERTPPELTGIEYHLIDATDTEQLLGLGAHRFDGAVATMCLMDMATIEPLMSTLPELLKPEGWFVFSIIHPCFQPSGFSKFAEATQDGEGTIRRGVKISSYLTPTAWKSEGIVGQPELQFYFHRPLSVLFETAFKHGFVIDGFEEPRLADGPIDGKHLRWRSMADIPPVLVVRMRRART